MGRGALMSSNADSEAQGGARAQREARREFMRINERHDADLGKARVLFVELMAAAERFGGLPAEQEKRFWTSIDSAVRVAADSVP